MKSQPPTGITQATIRIVSHIVVVSLVVVLAVNAIRFGKSEIHKQEVQSMTISIQTRQSENFEELDSSARGLVLSEPFRGAFASIQADALSTVVLMSPQIHEPGSLNSTYWEIRELYRTALEITPENGYLWARYAVFVDHVYGAEQREQIISAWSEAIDAGARDYNTIRLIGKLGIKRWPWLSCEDRGRLVDILGYAESVDDLILARWNSDLRFSQLQKDLEQQSRHYGFNLTWARLHASRCGAS